MKNCVLQSGDNLICLGKTSYPGRGIIMGMSMDGNYAVQIYWVMGRSENSQNRVMVHNGDGLVSTRAFEPEKMKDPRLVIYNAMNESTRYFVVSNGEQTDRVQSGLVGGADLPSILSQYQYEPDFPNCTPRITGVCMLAGMESPIFKLSIVRKSLWGTDCDRLFYNYETIHPGYGYCITTYMGDGSPLPSFRGEPRLMPIVGDIDKVADIYWAALNKVNRVSLAVKFTPIGSGQPLLKIINKHPYKD